mmetsp:Transcript_35052/g.96924  ORF Transcript_35052/g.96924 Transcript_35052/m.96924 type:complete len:369 (+) Transcript_35052:86-1192(+)
MARPTPVRVNVEIPLRTLSAEDCYAKEVPTPVADGTDVSLPDAVQQLIHIMVPQGTEPGCCLRVEVAGGQFELIPLPPTVSAGDMMVVAHRADGSWRGCARTEEFSFLVPPDADAEQTVSLPDGSSLCFEMPNNVKAGQILNFQLLKEGGWTIKDAYSLPPMVRTPSALELVSGPYADVLEVVRSRGCLERLPVDGKGVLHVNVPFCGGFQEYAVLGNYIADHCLSRLDVCEATILATDISQAHSFFWAVAHAWYAEIQPEIRLQTCVKDLSLDPLPEVGLCIAIHPEVTKGGPWFQIIGSIVRSCRGICVFSTFYEEEMQTVVNMVGMYKRDGTVVDVVENPHYDSRDRPQASDMRYIILVQAPAPP